MLDVRLTTYTPHPPATRALERARRAAVDLLGNASSVSIAFNAAGAIVDELEQMPAFVLDVERRPIDADEQIRVADAIADYPERHQ